MGDPQAGTSHRCCRWLQGWTTPEVQEQLQRQVVAAMRGLQVEWTKDPDAPGAPSHLLKFKLKGVEFDLLLSENRSAGSSLPE
jgi:hypothetical protein